MAAPDPFDRGHRPPIGRPEPLASALRVVTAPNPGPMTFTGTRSYLLGRGRVAIIDPGPDDPAHRAALAAALDPGETVAAILVTHAHRDHSAGAAALGALLGAPVLAHGDPEGARSPRMARLAAAGGLGGGEGIDRTFRPDRRIAAGETIAGPGWTLTALATPGHLADHLSFAWTEGAALFTGDVVMGWASPVISPPDGDLGAFRASLARLQQRKDRIYYPGHGAPIADPQAMLAWLLAHRAEREAQIRAALAAGPATAPELVTVIYLGLDPALRPVAARSVLAHLVDLEERGIVASEGPLTAGARFGLA